MTLKQIAPLLGLILVANSLFSQRVIYSEPDRNDLRQTDFEIIGKVGGNLLVYKNYRESHDMSVYNDNMEQIKRVRYDFMPDRVLHADFIAYPDYAYMFYQYQRRNVMYCMGVKIDGNGQKVGEPVTIDTTEINFWSNSKIYSIINSEDKQHIAVVKINSKNEKSHLVTTAELDKNLQLQQKSYINVPMPDKQDFLSEFQLDNDGNMVFARAVQGQMNDNIQQLYVLTKPRLSGDITETNIPLNDVFLDDVRIKVDNFNKHYIITSFFSKSRHGNIEGLYVALWDQPTRQLTKSGAITFSDGIRSDAKGDNTTKSAFNDYYLRNIIVKRDGGFLLAAEAFYTTGRGGMNRGNYFYGSPYSFRPMDYYMFSPYSYSYPWWRYNGFNSNQLNRYHAENIAVFSFDSLGKVSWSNVLNKSQWDDDTDAFIGYLMMNTGDQLHFLFNQQEKRTQLLSDQSIDPKGQIYRSPTLKNLDKGYDIMPRYGKQIANRTVIFPCMYRNYLCFARLEL